MIEILHSRQGLLAWPLGMRMTILFLLHFIAASLMFYFGEDTTYKYTIFIIGALTVTILTFFRRRREVLTMFTHVAFPLRRLWYVSLTTLLSNFFKLWNLKLFKDVLIGLSIAGMSFSLFLIGDSFGFLHIAEYKEGLTVYQMLLYAILSAPLQQWVYTIQPALFIGIGSIHPFLMVASSSIFFGFIHSDYEVITMCLAGATLGIACAYVSIVRKNFLAAILLHIIGGVFALEMQLV